MWCRPAPATEDRDTAGTVDGAAPRRARSGRRLAARSRWRAWPALSQSCATPEHAQIRDLYRSGTLCIRHCARRSAARRRPRHQRAADGDLAEQRASFAGVSRRRGRLRTRAISAMRMSGRRAPWWRGAAHLKAIPPPRPRPGSSVGAGLAPKGAPARLLQEQRSGPAGAAAATPSRAPAPAAEPTASL